MPWVLWTSWGRYCMEGDQQRESGPANRLRVQVLDNSCFHRASLESTSVQGPERRLNMHAKSFFIRQICFLNKHSSIFLISVWWLLFGHRADFYFPLINGRSKTDVFSSGFIDWSPVTHSINIIIKEIIEKLRTFMICLHGHAWFLWSQREVWRCYDDEDNLAKDLLDKNNFPWCYCTRRLLNKRSNLWRERPLWVLFMLSWREFFNRHKSVLCFQRVTTLASTFKCQGWCWWAVRVALPSLLIFLNIYEKVIYRFRQPSGPNMLLSTHHLHTWYSTACSPMGGGVVSSHTVLDVKFLKRGIESIV